MERHHVYFRELFNNLALITLIIAIIIVALFTQEANQGFKDAAAILTFITGAAVAIERIIETCWIIIGGIWGSYWPLNAIREQVDSMATDLGNALQPFHNSATFQLAALVEKGAIAQSQIPNVEQEIQRMKARFDELLALTPDN